MTIKEIVTLGDVQRGLEHGVAGRVLFQELSVVADLSRGKRDVVSLAVRRGLVEVAEKIHNSKKTVSSENG